MIPKVFRQSPILALAFAFLAFVVVVAIAGNIFTPYGYSEQHLLTRLKPPAFLEDGDLNYWLGTDRLGRDLVARLVFGLRISVLDAIAGTLLGGIAGIFLVIY